MDPEWSDLKILAALSRGGSFSGAARILNVDHSTVSRRLAALEDAVEARLIVRGGRELAWTAEGRTMLRAAQSIEGIIAEAARDVRSAKVDAEGAVRLSVPPGISSTLARVLPALREKHPLLAIELRAENRVVDLAKGEADIALRMFRPNEPGLVCRRAFELGWGVYASRAYLAEHGTPASVDDLPNHRLILYVEAVQRAAGPRWLEVHRGTAPAFGHVDNTEVAAQMIASGGGIGVVPCLAALSHPQLVPILQNPIASSTGFIVYHEATRDTARVRAAVEVLLGFFEANAAALSGVESPRGS
jgi:DNA-binding transcriptional LysR family regulator